MNEDLRNAKMLNDYRKKETKEETEIRQHISYRR